MDGIHEHKRTPILDSGNLYTVILQNIDDEFAPIQSRHVFAPNKVQAVKSAKLSAWAACVNLGQPASIDTWEAIFVFRGFQDNILKNKLEE
jgi:hypothetical protein